MKQSAAAPVGRTFLGLLCILVLSAPSATTASVWSGYLNYMKGSQSTMESAES